MNTRRPVGITILAVVQYGAAAWYLGLGIVRLLGKNAMMRSLHALDRSFTPEFPRSNTSWSPLELGILSFLGAAFFYCFARGLWKLKNWARVLRSRRSSSPGECSLVLPSPCQLSPNMI